MMHQKLFRTLVPGLVVTTKSLTSQLQPGEFQVLLLDGTWRKTHKLLQLNPTLQSLPRLALSEVKPSDYVIRKSNRAEGLSTLEAIYALLTQLEKAGQFEGLMQSFDAFMTQRTQFAKLP